MHADVIARTRHLGWTSNATTSSRPLVLSSRLVSSRLLSSIAMRTGASFVRARCRRVEGDSLCTRNLSPSHNLCL